MEAAKNIGTATAALVKAATAAHRELVAQGKLKVYDVGSDDSQWSEGLVSAVSHCNCSILGINKSHLRPNLLLWQPAICVKLLI